MRTILYLLCSHTDHLTFVSIAYARYPKKSKNDILENGTILFYINSIYNSIKKFNKKLLRHLTKVSINKRNSHTHYSTNSYG